MILRKRENVAKNMEEVLAQYDVWMEENDGNNPFPEHILVGKKGEILVGYYSIKDVPAENSDMEWAVYTRKDVFWENEDIVAEYEHPNDGTCVCATAFLESIYQ
jgi:hypothetical protein